MQDINSTLFFDIETIGTKDEKILELIYPMPERKETTDAPRNYKNEETILKWIESEYIKDLDKRTKAVEKAALDQDSAIIRSIAWAIGENPVRCIVGDESIVLRHFLKVWGEFKSGNYDAVSCGYNSVNYDWSVILRRIVANNFGDFLLFRPNMNRFSGEIDLMALAFNHGYAAGKKKSMKTLAKLLGIKVPAGDVTGADVATLTSKELLEYNVSDVTVIREIFKKFNGVYL